MAHILRAVIFIAAVGLILIMFVTVINVFSRFFWVAIPGTYDFVRFLSAFAISLSLGYCAHEKGHIVVEIIKQKLPRKIGTKMGAILSWIAFGLFSIVTYACFVLGKKLYTTKTLSMTANLPLYPVAYGISFSFLVLTIVILYECILLTGQAWRDDPD